jgi:hypothetical protein
VDAELALPTLLAGLEKNRLLHDEEGSARLAVPDGDRYRIVYPEAERGQRLL